MTEATNETTSNDETATTQAPDAAPETVYVLRTCDADMTSHGGFQWPESGPVECSDWDPTQTCGHGLHGLLKGEGSGNLLSTSPDAKWLVVRVLKSEIVELHDDGFDKVKFPRGFVVLVGTRDQCVKMIQEKYPEAACAFGVATSDGGTAQAGYGGTAQAGDGGTAQAGYGGTAQAGDRGTAQAGYGGTAQAGDGGTAQAGDRGTAKAGYGGTAQAGDGGTAQAGDRGTAQAGDRGTAKAGDRGTAKAGECGIVELSFYETDAKGNYRQRIVLGYIGEDGLEIGVSYKIDPVTHKIVKAEP